MRINHNISALKINNILNKNNSSMDRSLERLSSGYRINRAADDAAGLAISEKMKTQIAGLNQASRNASDGISVIQTAEGALIEVEQMLQRMRELAVQAANGTYTDEDRKTLQDEVDQLKQEIERISDTTEFNTKTLLDGTVDRRSYSDNPTVKVISTTDSVAVKSYCFDVEREGTQAVITSKIAALTAPTDGTITVNNQAISIEEGDTLDIILEKLNTVCDNMGIYVGFSDGTEDASAQGGFKEIPLSAVTVGTGMLVFVTDDYGKDAELSVSCNEAQLCRMLGLSTTGEKAVGSDARISLITSGPTTGKVKCDGLTAGSDYGEGTVIYKITNQSTGKTETVKFTVETGKITMEYTNADGAISTKSEIVSDNKTETVLNTMKNLIDGFASSTARFEIADDYSSCTLLSTLSDVSVSMDVEADIRKKPMAEIIGREYDNTVPAQDGTLSVTFANAAGEEIYLKFDIDTANSIINMEYKSSDGTINRDHTTILGTPGTATVADVESRIEALYSTITSPEIDFSFETAAGTGNVYVSAKPLDEGYTTGTLVDDRGISNALTTSVSGSIDTASAGSVNAGTFTVNVTDALGTASMYSFAYNGTDVTLTYPDPADNTLTKNSAAETVATNDTAGVAAAAQAALTAEGIDVFSVSESAGTVTFVLKDNTSVLTLNDNSGALISSIKRNNVDGSSVYAGGDVTFDITLAGTEKVTYTYTQATNKITVTYTDGTDSEIVGEENLPANFTVGTLLEKMNECGRPKAGDRFTEDSQGNISWDFSSDASAVITGGTGLFGASLTVREDPSGEAEDTTFDPGYVFTKTPGSADGGFSKTATMAVNGDYVTVRDRDGFEMVLQVGGGSIGKLTTVTVLEAGPMTLQIGANEGQTMEVRIPCVDTTTLFIKEANIATQDGAQEAITLFDKAVNQVSAIRAKLGAYQNRLDHAINSLDTSAENLTEALSRIADTDMASEMASYTQLQVLVQAATSMLSQANERPQNILSLLQG